MSKHIQSMFDIDPDLWPTSLTYIPKLARINIGYHAKMEVLGQTVQTGKLGQAELQTNERMDANKCIISPPRGR